MESVSIRRPTCKAPKLFGADHVDPVSFCFQLSPQTRRTEGRLWRPAPAAPTRDPSPPRPAPPAHGSSAPPSFTPLINSSAPRAACRAGLCPEEVAGLSSKGQGPLLGSTGLPHRLGTGGTGARRSAMRLSSAGLPQGLTCLPHHPSAQVSALFCSEPFTSPLLSDSGKQPYVVCPRFGCNLHYFTIWQVLLRQGRACCQAWCQGVLAI